jgi:hypothetical protein
MNRHDFLTGIHTAYRPRSYLEIGVSDGRGVQRSSARTIGVDPSFKITAELHCDLQLVKATSDDFFARQDAISHFTCGVVDFAFIDGMHLFEFALRDFRNTERLSSPNSVIVLDDMLPRSGPEATRERHTLAWAGDVYKLALALERYRPDLVVVPVDTTPTGVLLVLGADPANTVLTDRYEQILAEFAHDDPQQVPDVILRRGEAADPAALLALPVWTELAAARDGVRDRPADLDAVRALRGTARYVSRPPDPGVWPPRPPKGAAPPAAGRRTSPASARSLLRRVRRAVRGRR